MIRKTSPQGVAFVANEEGFVDHIYLDSAGIPTEGFGHVVHPGDPTHEDRVQAMAQMAADLIRFEQAVSHDVLVPLTQCQFDALVSFCYNAGAGALDHSTALRLLNQDGNYTGAAEALLMWDKRIDKTTGQEVVDAGLLARRKRERDLFLSDGDAAASDNPYGVNPPGV